MFLRSFFNNYISLDIISIASVINGNVNHIISALNGCHCGTRRRVNVEYGITLSSIETTDGDTDRDKIPPMPLGCFTHPPHLYGVSLDASSCRRGAS